MSFSVDLLVWSIYRLRRILNFLYYQAWLLWPVRPHRRQQQCTDRRLLFHLPTELILTIADELPPASRVLLAHTCHTLYAKMHATSMFSRALQDMSQLSQAQRIEFLATVARDQVDYWCCESCVALHRVVLFDQTNCFLDSSEDFLPSLFYSNRHKDLLAARRGKSTRTPWPFCVRHRHAQLALKYVRMLHEKDDGDRNGHRNKISGLTFYHRYYLRRLLATFHQDIHVGFIRDNLYLACVPCSFHPRIVMAPDGRRHYILLSIMEGAVPGLHFRDRKAPHHKTPLCAHLSLNYGNTIIGGIAQMVGGEAEASEGKSIHAEEYFWPAYNWRGPIRQSDTATATTWESLTSCRRCPTDITFRGGRWYIYRDFGPEGAATDLAWQIHLHGECMFSTVTPKEFNGFIPGPSMYHKAGSIEALYEGRKEAYEVTLTSVQIE